MLLTTYAVSSSEEVLLHRAGSRAKVTVYLYNIHGDLIYQFPINKQNISKVLIPLPTSGYYIAKFVNTTTGAHEYVILKPEDHPDELLFVFKPRGDTAVIESENGVYRKKLVFLFDDLAYCDISNLPKGKYVVRIGDRIYGFEITNPVYATV